MHTRRHWMLSAAAAMTTVGAGCAAGRRGPQVMVVPGARSDDWERAAASGQGIAQDALDAVLRDGAQLPALRSLVVVRQGRLVAERYYHGASADDLRPIHSVTKSVASMLVGQALAQGVLPGLDASVGSLLPEALARGPDPGVAARVTLRQILSARTGLAYDWRKQTGDLARSRDPVGLALALPADPAGAQRWTYNDAAVNLLSAILTRAHGIDLAAVAARDLFAPLGIDRVAWARDGNGNASTYGGLRLRTRDLARLTWVMANGGRWRAAQVLPAAWVDQSTRPYGPAGWRVRPIEDIGYGYLWFTGTLHGQAVAWGWGYGAQFALLAPSLGLAVATAAEAPSEPSQLGAQNAAVMALVARVVQAAV